MWKWIPRRTRCTREPPLELHLEQRIEFDAEIFLVEGNSLDVITDWVTRHGLPEPPAPRWPFEEALDIIAGAYNTNFWHEGKGFGTPQTPGSIGPHVPGFVDGYFARRPETPLVKELRAKVAWCQAAGASRAKRIAGSAIRGSSAAAGERAGHTITTAGGWILSI